MNPEEIEKRNAANEARLQAKRERLKELEREIELNKARLKVSDAVIERYHSDPSLKKSGLYILLCIIGGAAVGFITFISLS